MKKKLYASAKNQLPGGLYWDPEAEVEEILKKLPPTNDLCESLDNHLTTSIRNLCQLSNLIKTKNKTMQWLAARGTRPDCRFGSQVKGKGEE